ncbi:MAG: DUF4332 domain-containing protein [Pyrinomonadaceae bacterium MAG19_C2-C3]|nr:DUF4332 domain-containing protein [Pyrinomonadaceae bacterium MAG19_C2-C3]
MTRPNDILLTEIKGWTLEHIRKLARIWIVTAGHVLDVGATPEGVRSLAEHLGIAEKEARRLIAATKARIAAESDALERPKNPALPND